MGGALAEAKPVKILVYRRTHTGDPSPQTGEFGVHDCMGRVRDWDFDAVIGIGGKKPWPGYEKIAEKITWVGVGVDQKRAPLERAKSDANKQQFGGHILKFHRWIVLDEDGPLLKDVSPILHKYMFSDGRIPRAALNVSGDIGRELNRIIDWTLKTMDQEIRRQRMSDSLASQQTPRGLPAQSKVRRGRCS